jgi:hypothetical protein
MVELHSWIIIAWTIGTALIAFGSAWGAVRVTQKSVAATLKELRDDMINLQFRVGEDEKNYTSRDGCRELRVDCREQQSKDNVMICSKIEEVKSLLIAMAENRIKTKDSNADKFSEIRERLAKIETSLSKAI